MRRAAQTAGQGDWGVDRSQERHATLVMLAGGVFVSGLRGELTQLGEPCAGRGQLADLEVQLDRLAKASNGLPPKSS
jgi:hypothetical protein